MARRPECGSNQPLAVYACMSQLMMELRTLQKVQQAHGQYRPWTDAEIAKCRLGEKDSTQKRTRSRKEMGKEIDEPLRRQEGASEG